MVPCNDFINYISVSKGGMQMIDIRETPNCSVCIRSHFKTRTVPCSTAEGPGGDRGRDLTLAI